MSQNPEADLGEILEFFDDELGRVDWYADWYKKHAAKTKIKYLAVRVPLIVLGVIVPQLIALQSMFSNARSLTLAAVVIATLVAVLAGLDTFFHWGELYVDDKAAELSLYAVIRRHQRKKLDVDLESDLQAKLEKAKQVLDSLRSEYEQIISGATRAFLERASTVATQKPE